MELKFDKNQLLEYLVSFYRLTRMRVVLFGPESHIICSYPESDCPFCHASLLESTTVLKKPGDSTRLCDDWAMLLL